MAEVDKPTKYNVREYVCHILSSPIDVRFAPSMRDQARPIVTCEEIRNGRDLCPHRVSGRKILEISGSMILKIGYGVSMGEAEAMCLVRNLTTVPVPKVLNAYMIEDIGFILMERVPGIPLEECWDRLSIAARKSIVQQLKDYVQQWRRIEGTFFGSVDGGPCEDVIFKHPWGTKPYRYGPFQTRKEFNAGVVLALQRSRPNDRLIGKRDCILADRILASGENGQDERKIFTHGDLHPTNIIIDDDKITGIIDWGASGYSVASREHFGLKWATDEPSWRELSSSILASDEYEFWADVNNSMTDYTGI
ncbi:hypothetical protein DTO164E3_8440 [Paecilomyces variotii]|nr:hypothetical protein DTO164E3_8440 [Paecilomyces variotii]KAJ9205112.1 hypothetical protein DTO032I3_2315 [Paecilomyces variotii]KAJ9219089.1 hypothetical protein DTO169C6_8599 [Paecilomyces variotii]KAJ9274478.1 hypothetical protein DTO021D3_8687 [Paecilomyces variotii]KAJ9313025.1 hypothetical protein DTO271D3_6627 [Paecilomyces variotii]